MKNLDLTQLTTEELQIELKKRKQGYQIAAFIVGMMMGCAVWSLVQKGLNFFIFVPFVFAYWFRSAKPEYEQVKKEIEFRTIKQL